MSLTEEILSPVKGNPLSKLRSADLLWYNLRHNQLPISQVVSTKTELLPELEWDVVIAGGTLGILLGAALQQLGWRVALVERGILRGREQEWNISRQELQTFLELELLSETELEQAIATEFNPVRVSFAQGEDIWIRDVLNIGVDPVFLLATLKNKFLQAGGILLENTPFQGVTIYENGASIQAGEKQLTCSLFIDAMGHFSPIAAQGRQGEKPQGICLVVGSCAQGYPENHTGDLIVSFTPIQNQCQYFWEAFPAKDGRTTYMFTYLDPHEERPSLEFFMEEYLRLLPQYQKIELSQLNFERFLFGFFPSYRRSPLHFPWNHILAIGDSSGSQSPVSFGGFGSLVRHLKRLTYGINEALTIKALNSNDISLLQPYQPNISVTWLFQKTMSVSLGQKCNPHQINNLMNEVFRVMNNLGDEVLKPFLQDVIKFSPLTKTLPLVKPNLVLPLLPQIGLPILLDWLQHYLSLGAYTGLDYLAPTLTPVAEKLSPSQQYYYHRWRDAWKYGSGRE